MCSIILLAMANTIEAFLFQIPELASIVLSFCDITASKHLTSVNRRLYNLRTDELLWRNKVQKEFGVIRFKPAEFTFLQQYLTLDNNISPKMVQFNKSFESRSFNENIVGGRAAALGRCDQLRIVRRASFVSCHDLSIIAIKYDQRCIIEYLENFEKYLLPYQHWNFEIGPNIFLYLINKVFNDRNNVHGPFEGCREHYFILRSLLFQAKVANLLIEQGKADVLLWWIDFIPNDMVANQQLIYNNPMDAI